MPHEPRSRVHGGELRLEIQGLGIIMYSPSWAKHIQPGEDYLSQHYMNGSQVQPHIQAGSLVGFGTGSPGAYRLRFHEGYPDDRVLADSPFKLRLGLHVVDGIVHFRDLYDLMDWDPACPDGQTIELANGYYHVTLCSSTPPSGVIGDDQLLEVYLQPVPEMPALARTGVPTLVRQRT
jgi:hypothetical protein